MNARSALYIAIVATAMIDSCVSSAGGASFAAHRILHITTYTFGPVGFGTGRTSEGESLYYTILKSPSALSNFDYVWEQQCASACVRSNRFLEIGSRTIRKRCYRVHSGKSYRGISARGSHRAYRSKVQRRRKQDWRADLLLL